MNIAGWAMTNSPKRQEYKQRYQEIHHLKKDFEWSISRGYAHFKYKAKPISDEARDLCIKDVAILADGGNLCFGGTCSYTNGIFFGKVYTD